VNVGQANDRYLFDEIRSDSCELRTILSDDHRVATPHRLLQRAAHDTRSLWELLLHVPEVAAEHLVEDNVGVVNANLESFPPELMYQGYDGTLAKVIRVGLETQAEYRDTLRAQRVQFQTHEVYLQRVAGQDGVDDRKRDPHLGSFESK
jgi:hypothetical protein